MFVRVSTRRNSAGVPVRYLQLVHNMWDPVARTVWSAIYDLEARSVELDFYLGETPHGQQRRSPSIKLTLAE